MVNYINLYHQYQCLQCLFFPSLIWFSYKILPTFCSSCCCNADKDVLYLLLSTVRTTTIMKWPTVSYSVPHPLRKSHFHFFFLIFSCYSQWQTVTPREAQDYRGLSIDIILLIFVSRGLFCFLAISFLLSCGIPISASTCNYCQCPLVLRIHYRLSLLLFRSSTGL